MGAFERREQGCRRELPETTEEAHGQQSSGFSPGEAPSGRTRTSGVEHVVGASEIRTDLVGLVE
jgi:hypothetical protein